MKNVLAIAFLFLALSCNQQKSDKKTEPIAETTTDNNAQSVKTAPNNREEITQSGKTIIVEETHPQGMSLSDVAVYFKGDSLNALKIFEKDPISKVILADLDGNGFDELYVVTTSAGSGSYGNVHGFASNKDKSLSLVYLPEVEEKDMKKGSNFEGYEGHDLFEINGKQLIRSFPIGKQKRKIIYQLIPSETGYTLKPVSSKTE
ncbi:MAG: hypothetical protein FGM46_02920 [Ferruginibacter sp.]|nr:hypothetical protein [Ferruginibacter sp.]